MLLTRSHLVPAVENILKKHPKTSAAAVVTQNQLKGDIYADRLVIVGAASWFPLFVVQAPRAKQLVILRYRWVHEQRREQSFFIDGWAQSDATAKENGKEAQAEVSWSDDVGIHESELLSQSIGPESMQRLLATIAHTISKIFPPG